jgi:heme-degrading monooxygenase HmoA
MSYIRTTAFSLPRDEAVKILPGNRVYNALIPARKYVTQAIDGLIQTAVWRSTNASGGINFVIFTEWSTLEDMQGYANDPDIKEIEDLLSTDESPLVINVYETIG